MTDVLFWMLFAGSYALTAGLLVIWTWRRPSNAPDAPAPRVPASTYTPVSSPLGTAWRIK